MNTRKRKPPFVGRYAAAVIVVIATLPLVQCHGVGRHFTEHRRGSGRPDVASLSVPPVSPPDAAPQTHGCGVHRDLAASDPLAFLKMCREHYAATVADYRCTFTKQERIAGVLTAEQEMEILFREDPFSVDVRWIRNATLARRVNYVAGRWVRGGREMFLVEPAGLLSLLFPRGIKQDVHGPAARAAARRTIDQFGFRNTLDWIIRYCEMARGDPAYELKFAGFGVIGGRPTYVLERRLPFTKENDPYPDRLQIIHIDCQWLVPTGCFAYADDAGRQLLGAYVTTDVVFNVGLTDADF